EEGWLRPARPPPGGTQAITGPSAPCRARASSAAQRSACKLPSDPCTPTIIRRTAATMHRLLTSRLLDVHLTSLEARPRLSLRNPNRTPRKRYFPLYFPSPIVTEIIIPKGLVASRPAVITPR